MSHIVEISCKRLVNTGNSENFTLEAVAALDVGDDATVHLRALQVFVDNLCTERLKAVAPWRAQTADLAHPTKDASAADDA